MPDFDNTNRGALFKNKDKKAENHPDYKGQINVSGIEYWVSAWLKESKAGEKYMSLSVVPKDTRDSRKEANRPASGASRDADSDVPFAPIKGIA